MDEKEILKRIKEDSETMEPPTSLQPDAIEEMLRKMTAQASSAEGSTAGNSQKASAEPSVSAQKTSGRPRRLRRILQFGSLAAVFALALLAFTQSDRILKRQAQPEATVPQDSGNSGTQSETGARNNAETQNEADTSGSATISAGKAAISDTQSEAGARNNTETQSETITRNDAFTYAASYEDIYHTLYEKFGQNYLMRGAYYDAGGMESSLAVSSNEDGGMPAMGEMAAAEIEEDAAFDTVTSADYTSAAGTGSNPGYSQTNLQEAGVDEGDIVKTDGKYIYILRQNGSLAIVQADPDNPAVVSTTDLSGADNISVHEMYLDGSLLSVILSRYTSSLESDKDVFYTRCGRETVLLTYDISDRTAPMLTGTVTQDGSYEDSRKNGPYIYLFTCYSPALAETYAESLLIPVINKTQIPADHVYLPESPGSSSYLVISSVDTGKPSEVLDSRVLVSGASNYYVSTGNIYIANEHYNDSYMGTTTELIKFHYEKGTITGIAAGTVRGYLNNSFSMNEYKGMLRLVTTYYGDHLNAVRDFVGDLTGTAYEENRTEHNGLYILDETLHTVGSIEDLAEGEIIRSARFLGDTGYFVTFRQTDPLFSVDLSDPANPQILGELKISGFSSYLHFYGEHLLLGIGYEADEETGITSGLKLSMFDISDPSSVQEVSRFVLPGITWCPALEDYKAILVSPEKNMIGFLCDNRYMLFSYDEESGFTRGLLYDFYSDMLADQAQYYNMRGLYIEDTLYLAGDTFVITFDMNDSFEKKAVLQITDRDAVPQS